METLEVLIDNNRKSILDGYENDGYLNSSYFSKLIYFWSYKIIKLASKTQIKNKHLGKLEGKNKAEDFCLKFLHIWNIQNYKSSPLFKALIMSNLDLFLEISFFIIISFVFELCDVFLFKSYINIYENEKENFPYKLKIAISFILVKLVNLVIQRRIRFLSLYLSDRPLIQLNYLIIMKVLKENPSNTKNKYSQGELVNLIASDADKVKVVFQWLAETFFMPFKSIIYIIIIFNYMGITFCFSLITLGIIIFTNFYLQSYRTKIEIESTIVKDARMKVSTELLNNLKFAKLFCWESEFLKRIFSERNKELALIWKRFVIGSISGTIFNSCPQIICFVAIGTYYLVDGEIVLSNIFLLINIFNYLQETIVFLPIIIVFTNDLLIGLSRIEKYIDQDEIDEKMVKTKKDSDIAIEIKNGNFSWGIDIDDQKTMKSQIVSTENTYKLTLKNINFKVLKGELLIIFGEVGSGKSSLMQAILNNLLAQEKSKTEITINGSVSYVSQSAWIRNNTLRENITFFNKFDKDKYEKVIKLCELTQDLNALPGGDLTEIGEKGINLSGGQKARINIARSIYSESDIYLFDDPISALDSHVGEKIMTNCILGHLKGKSRILITHAIQYLNYSDSIIVMNNGEIFWEGKFEKLKNEDFYKEYVKNLRNKTKEKIIENEQLYSHKSEMDKIKRITTNEDEEEVMNYTTYFKYLSYYGSGSFMILIIFGKIFFY